jgi:hypothetical protein
MQLSLNKLENWPSKNQGVGSKSNVRIKFYYPFGSEQNDCPGKD